MSELIDKRAFKGLNNNQLKIIAMISMFIDHVGLTFFPQMKIFRYLGRLAFPIYAYMIAEGCKYTKNRKKYLGLIAILAIIFQIVFFVFMKSIYQSILVNFSLSISAIFSIDSFIKNKNTKNRILMVLIILAIFLVSIVFPIIFEDYGFAIDYDLWGLCLPILVYFAPNKLWKITFTTILIILMAVVSGSNMMWWSLLTIPLLILYNGERGSRNLKYLFYLFYPLHLVLIYIIAFLLAILKYYL